MTNDREIPRYVLEDRLFERRLQRNLNSELERLNRLLAEQAELLQQRKALLSELSSAVQQRWEEQEPAAQELADETVTQEAPHE